MSSFYIYLTLCVHTLALFETGGGGWFFRLAFWVSVLLTMSVLLACLLDVLDGWFWMWFWDVSCVT